jgi:hypothetical protein
MKGKKTNFLEEKLNILRDADKNVNTNLMMKQFEL